MPTKVKLSDVTRESLVLQKKVLLIYHLTGFSQAGFCNEIGTPPSYLSELKRIGRVYDPRYSFLVKLTKPFHIKVSWLYDPGVLPIKMVAPGEDQPEWAEESDNFEQAQQQYQEILKKEGEALQFIESMVAVPEPDQGEYWKRELKGVLKDFFQPIDI